LGVIAIAPQSAWAQDPDVTPSARELWEEYPLHEQPAGATPTADETRVQPSGRRTSAPTGDADGGAAPLLVFGALGAVLALAGFTVLRRRGFRLPGRSSSAAPPGAPLLAAASVAAMVPDERRRSPRLTAVAPAPVEPHDEPAEADALHPPDPARPWTAELDWQDLGRGARFCVVGRPAGGGDGAVIAASEPLAWPPRDAAAVRQMRNDVARMEAALLGAGWAPLEPGEAWYSKRFAWTPTEPLSAGRFKRETAWPADAEDLWRCEIKWQPGYVNSRFAAVTSEPEGRRGVTVGRSEALKWLFMADPSPRAPEQREEVMRMDERLLAAGWEPAGRGRDWYGLRYVWRHDGPPPLELDPAMAGTGDDDDER
jgi:hypothetical protein